MPVFRRCADVGFAVSRSKEDVAGRLALGGSGEVVRAVAVVVEHDGVAEPDGRSGQGSTSTQDVEVEGAGVRLDQRGRSWRVLKRALGPRRGCERSEGCAEGEFPVSSGWDRHDGFVLVLAPECDGAVGVASQAR